VLSEDALCGVLWLFLGWTSLGDDSGVGVHRYSRVLYHRVLPLRLKKCDTSIKSHLTENWVPMIIHKMRSNGCSMVLNWCFYRSQSSCYVRDVATHSCLRRGIGKAFRCQCSELVTHGSIHDKPREIYLPLETK
jgi:hypothetical protein